MSERELSKEEKRKKLFGQIIKFGVVGGLSFVIDFVITMIVSAVCRMFGMDVASAATVGGLFGFCISLVFNYFMSMKFVFERREDLNRKTEFLIFTILSLIGLALNEGILYFGMIFCKSVLPQIYTEYPNYATAGVKIVATGIVMIYNFISRKLTLEKKDEEKDS